MTTHHLDTSRSAYHEVIPKLNEKQEKVLAGLEGSAPMTNSELGEKLGWSINRVTPRVLELREAGLVRDLGKRRCRVTGRNAYQWTTQTDLAPGPAAKPKPRYEMVMVDGVRVARLVQD